jgi:predicted nuclease of predicted toxin-antitoxin system
VKLLFDQNLSRFLVRRLAKEYPESAHVVEVSLDTASDRIIWEYAAERDFVIVSKDSDFRQLAFLFGPPPKVVWLQVGNASTRAIEDVLRIHQGDVEAFGELAEESMLVLASRA